MWPAFQQFVLVPTRQIESANYRTYVSLNIGTISAFVVHLCVLPLFWWLGAVELLWLNIFSEAAYLSALWANRRGHHFTTIWIALIELSVHQAFCVKYIGWGTGFQYYLLVLPAMVFFLPRGRLAMQLLLLVSSTVAFVGLLAWSGGLAPIYSVAPDVQSFIAYANVTVVFGLLGFFGFNYQHAAEVAEERLAATERKQAEDRLVLLRAAVSAAQEMVVITDNEGKIEFVNQSFTRVTGYGPQEAIGNSFRLLKSGKQPDEFYSELWRTISAGHSWSGRIVNRRKNGELYTESATITPIKDDDGTIQHYLAIKQDITEAERAEEKLAKTEEQLRQAQKMEGIGTLAGGIAHDFNNLLTAILGSADFLREELPPDDEMMQDVDEIKRAGERAALLTRQLLAFSRKQVLCAKVLDLNQVIASIELLLRRAISEQVSLVLKLSPDAIRAEADEAQLGQVLLNLTVNAHDAMPNGGMLLIETDTVVFAEGVSINKFAVPPGRYAVVSVSDTGEGIAPDVLHDIFEPFFTTKEVGKGTGLGLSTVYGIVKQSGGHVSVHSAVGVGTTFKVYLPSTDSSASVSLPAPPLGSVRGDETVLLVEDDRSVRGISLRTLNACGYKVLDASNGREALALLDAHEGPVHLLFTDVMMPGIDGASLAERVRATRPDIKVIFASGYPGEIIAKHGDFIAGENFLSKPYSPEALSTLVRRVLDG